MRFQIQWELPSLLSPACPPVLKSPRQRLLPGSCWHHWPHHLWLMRVERWRKYNWSRGISQKPKGSKQLHQQVRWCWDHHIFSEVQLFYCVGNRCYSKSLLCGAGRSFVSVFNIQNCWCDWQALFVIFEVSVSSHDGVVVQWWCWWTGGEFWSQGSSISEVGHDEDSEKCLCTLPEIVPLWLNIFK